MPTARALVSVIIPAYNSARWLPEALDSVLHQTFKDLEVVVVDDGSTDNTDEVLARYQAHIVHVRRLNGGPSAARNTGIQSARGELIAFLDADDVWHEDKLRQQVTFLERRADVDIVFTNYAGFGERVDYDTGFDLGVLRRLPRREVAPGHFVITRESLLGDMLDDLFLRLSTIMLRRTSLDRVGLFDEAARYPYDDWQLCLRLSKAFRFGYIDQCLLRRRERIANPPWQRDRLALLQLQALDGLEKSMGVTPEERRLVERKRAGLARSAGYGPFARGNLAEARRLFGKSLQAEFAPRTLMLWLLSWLPSGALSAARSVKHALMRS